MIFRGECKNCDFIGILNNGYCHKCECYKALGEIDNKDLLEQILNYDTDEQKKRMISNADI